MIIAERKAANGSFYLKQIGNTIALRHKGIFTVYKYDKPDSKKISTYRVEGDKLCRTYGLSSKDKALEDMERRSEDHLKYNRWSR